MISECNSTVEDVSGFVASFNEKTPDYEQRLGYKIILDVAEKLHNGGQLWYNSRVISLGDPVDLRYQKDDFCELRCQLAAVR